jgi:UDP-N-acetylglucosamine 1-carboxyvinyltransferase
MKWLEVRRSGPLNGKIRVPCSKNSSLSLIAAACLADRPVVLNNLPNITDVHTACKIGLDIGLNIKWEDSGLFIDPTGILNPDIDPEKSSAFRTAYYFIGSMLAKHKKITLGYPGGDNIGPRPMDQHIKGLQALGAKFTFSQNYYTVEAERLEGNEIYFDVITSGATINLIMAAVLAKGRTILRNAARDPEVVDLAIFLNKMGAKIFGAGTDTIRIDGVSQLGGCTHTPIPDRLIAGAFLIGAGATGGKVTVNDITPEHLEACLVKLAEIGVFIKRSDSSITACGGESIKATRIRTGMYPEFVSDLQQPLTSLLLKAGGRSLIADRVFPQRFNHCEQLKRMGADISVRSGVARINGGKPLKGAWVHASDIRAGTSLILAGLIAEGVTYITGVEHMDRGYHDIAGAFQALGADIRLVENNEADTRTDMGN